MNNSRNQSRRRTPWDENGEDISSVQRFIQFHHRKHYAQKHEPLKSTGEAEVFNAFIPEKCPFCGKAVFRKRGFTENGIQRYECHNCRKRFTSATGTIYDSHKLSVSEWIDFLYNILAYVSLTADSWNNRNSFTTTRYWLEKLFMILEKYQEGIVLKGRITLDETYYSVRISDIEVREDGKKPRGLSKNQICIGVACDDERVFCVFEGFGKPTQKKTYAAFRDHIEPGSTLVHDKENSHKKLVRELGLTDEAYDSGCLKMLDDAENPLKRVNEIHNLIKKFFHAHNSFNRKSIKGYIDFFSFIMNPPKNKLEKDRYFAQFGISNS